jgi:hypothetical protein
MTVGLAMKRVFSPLRGRASAHSTLAFAAIGDHARLPARFFARLFASDGSLARR